VGVRDGGRHPHEEHNPSSMRFSFGANWRNRMTEWHKPEVTEQEVGLEVTSYLPAELDS
jgi:coenzyme PQQ precursor peptide PqqA